MNAKTADEVWTLVRAEVAAMHEPLLTGPADDLLAGLDQQTVNLLRIVAVTGWRLGWDAATDEAGRRLKETFAANWPDVDEAAITTNAEG